MWVRLPPPALVKTVNSDPTVLAHIIGIAIGDGNLSNPNSRAVRLRVSCDTKYPRLIQEICEAIQKLLPDYKVSIVTRTPRWVDISGFSNSLENLLDF